MFGRRGTGAAPVKIAAVAVACLGVAAGSCGSGVGAETGEPARLPVFGGTPTGACRWPQVVSVDDRCSGVLIHPRLVLYAAHCGVAVGSIGYDGTRLAVSECAAFPGAQVGGTDIAYCRLEQPLRDVAPALVVSPCEAAAVQPGATVDLVGFGRSEQEPFGTRRETTATIDSIGAELNVAGDAAGSCFGDSGGPLFASVPSGAATAVRVAGVLSSKDSGACPQGVLHYTPVAPFISWIERESGFDVTPCTDAAGAWDPNPDCLDGAASACEEEAGGRRSETCGSPASTLEPAPPLDLDAPGEGAVFHAPPGERAAVPFALSPVEARGVREVRLLVRDEAGEVVWSRATSTQPLSLGIGWLSPHGYHATAEVETFSGNVTTITRSFVVVSDGDGFSSCAVRPGPGSPTAFCGPFALFVALAALAARARRR